MHARRSRILLRSTSGCGCGSPSERVCTDAGTALLFQVRSHLLVRPSVQHLAGRVVDELDFHVDFIRRHARELLIERPRNVEGEDEKALKLRVTGSVDGYAE